MVTGEDTDGLQGFPKTHVVTQDAMKFVLVKESQPVHTMLSGKMTAITTSWAE